MPGRRYNLVCDEGDIMVKPQLKRENLARSGSVISDSESVKEKSYNYVCEVVKSPRAPQYEIHYVKTRKNGIHLVRKKVKIGRKLLDKKHASGDKRSVTNTDDDETVISDTTVQSRDDMVGLRVIACNRHDGLYYSGTINKTPESAFAVVTFNDKNRQKVRTEMIIPMSGAIARPELSPGDFVLVRVYNQIIHKECYVPGIVEVTPENLRTHNKFYSILLYNGQRETTMRRLIVKIGRARFEMAIRYITHIQQQNFLREQQATSEHPNLTSPHSTSSKKTDDETLSQQSSQSSRGRRKKEKLTKKLKEKKETEKRRKSKKKSRSRSSSRTNSSVSSRSSSRASSRSRSRSSKASSRSRSSSRSSSRSRSGSRSSSSTSTVKSRSSEEKLKKGKSSRARSRSSSRSSRSRSRGSGGSSTPRAKSPYERPHNPEPVSESRLESRAESRTGSRRAYRKDIYYEKNTHSVDITRSESHVTDASRVVNVDEKDEVIQTLQYQFEKQKRKQFRQERRLVRQARKINKIQRKLKNSDTSQNESVNSTQAERSEKVESVQSSHSETESSPRRRKGSPDGTSYHEQVDVTTGGRSRSYSVKDKEVLARWTDDGWYYSGYVVGDKGDGQYVVKDNTGYMEVIDRDDIITNTEHRFDAIQPEDFVIGLHPKYAFSYAPAEVLSVYSNDYVKVEFFDGNLTDLSAIDVYKISKTKYDQVLEYIKKCERRMIGKSVVARDDNTGRYKLGVIDSRVGLGQQYYVKWLDGDMSKQNSNHVFEVGKPQTNHEDWNYVLAPMSQNNTVFTPAEIIQSNPLQLQFYDGRRTAGVTMDQCFWISKEYYTNACALIRDLAGKHW